MDIWSLLLLTEVISAPRWEFLLITLLSFIWGIMVGLLYGGR